MNVAAVRKLAMPTPRQRALEEAREFADRQLSVTRCAKCPRWYYRGTVADGKRAYRLHEKSAGHTRRNQKRGPQQKTREQHAGRLDPRTP